jgi:hypothetical protein
VKLNDFIKEFLPIKKVIVKQDNSNGNAYFNGNEIANTINKTTNIMVTDKNQMREVYESVINEDSSVNLREAMIPIEALINEGKLNQAIQKYEERIFSTQFVHYSKDEKFLIYNGLLNCHINNNADDKTNNHWKVKIEALGTELKEIHRFYFLLGIMECKKNNLEKAMVYNNQSLIAKPNYMNAITTDILIKTAKNDITYDEAKVQLDKLLKGKGLSIKDLATIHSNYGELAFNSKDYTTAKDHYLKSKEFSYNLSIDIAIAICQYLMSFKEIKDNGRVDLDKIDFIILRQAEINFANIFNNKTEDTIQTIVRMSFPFYFNILALYNDYNAILKIYKDTEKYIDKTMIDTLNHVIEAQVINGILNEDILSLFNDYDQIKYEAFYYEKQGDFDRVVNLLTPVFEGKYKDDKILQLSFLTALKEKDDFEKYMQYYQKFSCHQDEVMRMNYIQFLMKKSQKELVIDEIRRIKEIAKNGFVLYDLLQIYLEYQLHDELDEFFKKVDNNEYNIIGLHRPFVFYQKMIQLLNQEKYAEYFNLYETSDLSILRDNFRLILKINYYMFKHDLDNLAGSYYELFQNTQNHNELIKAVQTKLQINQYHDADFYLEQVNPMELDNPEYYYMFRAIILKDKKQEEEAFEQLKFALETLDIDINSSFHQFYTAFNMNNNRIDEAIRYMGEYYSKNPNPNWFKAIQHSDDESGSSLLTKLEEAIGGKRDLTLINQFFAKGVIGISSYNKIVGTGIEEILYYTHYPFTRVSISRGNILETKSKVERIGNEIIIDATTLTILSATNAINLLEVFNEIIIPYSTMEILTSRKTGMFKENAIKALEYIGRLPTIKKLAVDENMKIRGNMKDIIPEDILDCISLSDKFDIPFLNTEVIVNFELKLNGIIDVNTLFFYLKEKYPQKRDAVAEVIFKMREMGIEFISFDDDDIYFVYQNHGIKGIEPFLKMGINADYKTFPPVYVNFLMKLYKNHSVDEFDTCSVKIIQFMDQYVGKTRYYMSLIISKYPGVEELFLRLIHKPSVRNIMLVKSYYSVSLRNAEEFLEMIESSEFEKMINIASAFIIFVFRFISLFNDNEKSRKKYIDLLNQNIIVNERDDINYILHFMNRLE